MNRPRADDRPRVHIWPTPAGANYAFGPTGQRFVQLSVGNALESAIDRLGDAASGGVVVIVEAVS